MKIATGFIILFSLMLSCSKDKENIEDCDSEDINVNIEFMKTSEKCSDIELLWDIKFGVSVEFEVDIQCESDCFDKTILYQTNEFIKRQDSVINLSSSIFSGSYYNCNNVTYPSMTLNTRKDDPEPSIYMVGDTLNWEFFNARLCLGDGINDCSTNYMSLDLPNYSFKYVITSDDFECE